MSVHEGHRGRVRRRFLEHGLESFDDITALEFLLFYANPRGDTNPLAHTLLEQFGSLDAVLEAPASELMKVPGIGENAAALLRLIPAVSRRYMVEKTPESEPVDSPARAGRYFIPRFLYEREEVVYALLLDARRRPLSCIEVGRGVVNAVEISVRRVASRALEKNASSVILAHNHLSGLALPSAEDESSTRQLRSTLAMLGIELADHIIVAGCDYISMKECGLLR